MQKRKHTVPESDDSDGIFHNEVAIGGLMNGVIVRMTCRWCVGDMVMLPNRAPDAPTITDPSTGSVQAETVGLVCPTCDASAASPRWGK